ncbi:hypothetical protein D3C76_22330 [compost metagenome]
MLDRLLFLNRCDINRLIFYWFIFNRLVSNLFNFNLNLNRLEMDIRRLHFYGLNFGRFYVWLCRFNLDWFCVRFCWFHLNWFCIGFCWFHLDWFCVRFCWFNLNRLCIRLSLFYFSCLSLGRCILLACRARNCRRSTHIGVWLAMLHFCWNIYNFPYLKYIWICKLRICCD